MAKKHTPGKEWKSGKGWKGSTRAAIEHHPEKFSKKACKEGGDGDKLCPYAVMQSMKKKGYESHYKDQESTLKGKPKKKKKFKNEDKKCFKEWLKEKHSDFNL